MEEDYRVYVDYMLPNAQKVLAKAGLSNGKQALEVFAGADADASGQLSFDEFMTIASAIC